MRPLLLLLLLTSTAHAQAPLGARRTVELGRPAFLAVARADPGAALSLRARSSDPAVVDVRGATFARGRRLAFLELTTRAAGRAVVRVGRGSCAVTVARGEGPELEIVAPADGAVLWGPTALAARCAVPVRWSVGDRPVGEVLPALPAGPHVVTAAATDRFGRTTRRAIRVVAVDRRPTVLRPAELAPPTAFGAMVDVAAPALRDGLAQIRRRREVLQWSFEMPRTGWIQLAVRARGRRQLTWPAFAVILDARVELPSAQAAIVRATTTRHALGAPFFVRKGSHRLSLVFFNDADGQTRRARQIDVAAIEMLRMGPAPADPVPPEVHLLAPGDGERVGGVLVVRAAARDAVGVRRTELWIDGRRVARVADGELVHALPGDALTPGEHTLQIRAVDAAGNVGRSRTVRVRRLPYRGRAPAVAVVASARSTPVPEADDEVLDLARPGLFVPVRDLGKGPAVFPLTLPAAGRYAVRVYARATGTEHGARPLVLSAGPARARLALDGAAYQWSRPRTLSLPAGRVGLRLALPEDGDTRALLVGRVDVRQLGVDVEAPTASIVWPAEGAEVAGTALVAAHASDNDRVRAVELLVGDRVVSRAGRGGLVGLWLHGQRLRPGPHTLRVRVTDAAGQRTTSAPRRIRWRARRAGEPLGPTGRGIRLLQRLGLGLQRERLARLLVEGEAAWLRRQLAPDPHGQRLARRLDVELRGEDPFNPRGLRFARVAQLRYSRRPLRERLASFVDNHFSTFVRKSGTARESVELLMFRRRCLGRLDRLIDASARSPSMLIYLDNTANRAGAANENYARELLELHTLGVDGGYDQRDVEQLTRALTGWTATTGHPRRTHAVHDAEHDAGAKAILGCHSAGDARAEVPRLLALLAAHPATARFVARKLCAMAVRERPSEALVDRVAEALACDGTLAAAVRAIVRSPGFATSRPKIADPLELIVGWSRQGTVDADIPGDEAQIDKLGRPLFGRAAPDGWPERGDAWMSAAMLLARWNAAERIAGRLDLAALLGPLGGEHPRERLIDDLAMSLLGRPLGATSRAAVRDAFPTVAGEPGVRALAALILRMPEAQAH